MRPHAHVYHTSNIYIEFKFVLDYFIYNGRRQCTKFIWRKNNVGKKNDPPPRKTLRVDDPLFEETINQMLLESDLSSDEEEDELYVEEDEVNRRHESEEESDAYEMRDEVIEHESSSCSSDNVPLSELTATNYYYDKNRYKWAKSHRPVGNEQPNTT